MLWKINIDGMFTRMPRKFPPFRAMFRAFDASHIPSPRPWTPSRACVLIICRRRPGADIFHLINNWAFKKQAAGAAAPVVLPYGN
ncbi:hypothetical protein [Janthinobacterium fluminis]|uniref:Uncharacterized protein n=1 Tax=Janthinobacterium fluminis TaxID=2987524 RepID=A0ABT5JWP1_9BURK|nr:hypothetical protein [Janthinobacterium fluminis]MDC8756891.1 hypothetical protein [Janthinobacterium fluminis]